MMASLTTKHGQSFNLNQVMEDGVAFLESSGVLNQVRELGIATIHWEEAVLAFRSISHHHHIKLENNVFREVAEQFDAFALEVAANRPENLRLINDQVISKFGFG